MEWSYCSHEMAHLVVAAGTGVVIGPLGSPLVDRNHVPVSVACVSVVEVVAVLPVCEPSELLDSGLLDGINEIG